MAGRVHEWLFYVCLGVKVTELGVLVCESCTSGETCHASHRSKRGVLVNPTTRCSRVSVNSTPTFDRDSCLAMTPKSQSPQSSSVIGVSLSCQLRISRMERHRNFSGGRDAEAAEGRAASLATTSSHHRITC